MFGVSMMSGREPRGVRGKFGAFRSRLLALRYTTRKHKADHGGPSIRWLTHYARRIENNLKVRTDREGT